MERWRSQNRKTVLTNFSTTSAQQPYGCLCGNKTYYRNVVKLCWVCNDWQLFKKAHLTSQTLLSRARNKGPKLTQNYDKSQNMSGMALLYALKAAVSFISLNKIGMSWRWAIQSWKGHKVPIRPRRRKSKLSDSGFLLFNKLFRPEEH